MTEKRASYLYLDEDTAINTMLSYINWDKKSANSIYKIAEKWVTELRGKPRKFGELEVFLQQYSLNTQEGLALMCLAEALLRVPDKKTANDLIQDKMQATNWLDGIGDTSDWLIKAASVGLMLSSKTLSSMLSHLSRPLIREALAKAMQIMGGQFVLGRNIEEAFLRAQNYPDYRMSYDMLGEGARTMEDAEKYFQSYMHAIEHIGQNAHTNKNIEAPGISIKLSALHPRYEYAHSEKCVPFLSEKLLGLTKSAAKNNITITVDAEESERLELSLKIIENVFNSSEVKDFEGFGLAIQAYQKRCFLLIDHLSEMSKTAAKKIQLRLVKGAYWDREIKHAQLGSFEDYPVFTRKINSDFSYLACAQKMIKNHKYIYPMFATHNAHSISSILHQTQQAGCDFELQRLHGMGEGLYELILQENPETKATIYAPVGPYSDLLAYLVRRLLENGANSSFVNQILDPSVSVQDLIEDPVQNIQTTQENRDRDKDETNKHGIHRHSKIPLPQNIYTGRKNSKGIDLNNHQTAQNYQNFVQEFSIDNNKKIGCFSLNTVDHLFEKTQEFFENDHRKNWSSLEHTQERAKTLENIADLFEAHDKELIATLVKEAGKTIPDAHMEVREAIDFCRYYAIQGRSIFSKDGQEMPGPTGESNVLYNLPRGIFVCISPWNFPLANFTGQIVAAIMAGNAVIAKPAEQTPRIAQKAIDLMHQAGVPKTILNLVIGDGKLGAKICAHNTVAGVAFTGSTEAAKSIQKTLAEKSGAIVPLIAETGGQNAMIVDSSALPEQVIDDVIVSAFGAAGQRCSALRVLYLQEEISDKMLRMLKGAMAELVIADPQYLSSDIGPVIDQEALQNLLQHKSKLNQFANEIYTVKIDKNSQNKGHYFAPCAYEISKLNQLDREVFGPVLHVIRYRANDIETIIKQINDSGYGLTFGVHSRIDTFQKKLSHSVQAGNIYINRSIIGAVVGSQPFGGQGLSGTGPKAGGPNYLHSFATEKHISIDTTASGGNTTLISLTD